MALKNGQPVFITGFRESTDLRLLHGMATWEGTAHPNFIFKRIALPTLSGMLDKRRIYDMAGRFCTRKFVEPLEDDEDE